jgi:hypothetical protein
MISLREQLFGLETFQVSFHHHDYQFLKGHRGFPTQLSAWLGGIADQQVDFGGRKKRDAVRTWASGSSPRCPNATWHSSRTLWVSPVPTT